MTLLGAEPNAFWHGTVELIFCRNMSLKGRRRSAHCQNEHEQTWGEVEDVMDNKKREMLINGQVKLLFRTERSSSAEGD